MIIMQIVFVAFALIEAYYWLIYFPRAWRKPGTNREIDDLRQAWDWWNENERPLP